MKDPAEALDYAALRNLVQDFHGTTGKRYVAKLLAKSAVVAADPVAVAKALGADAERAWTVRPLMTTRRPVAAAFVPNSPVLFTPIDEMVRLLGSTD